MEEKIIGLHFIGAETDGDYGVYSEEEMINKFLRILAKDKLEYLDTQDLLDILNK